MSCILGGKSWVGRVSTNDNFSRNLPKAVIHMMYMENIVMNYLNMHSKIFI